MGVMQHHDAVTGTEKQHVANDYARILQIGFDKCSENIKEALNQLTVDDDNSQISRDEGFDSKYRFDYESCADLNISSCDIAENSAKFVVTLYNPLAHSTHQYVRVPVTGADFEVLDYRNVPVPSQIVSIPNEVRSLAYRRSNADSEVVFLANELPPVGYKSYFVQRKSAKKVVKTVEPMVMLVSHKDEFFSDDPFTGQETGPFTIGNQYLNLSFDVNGLLDSAATEDTQMKVRQNFYIYQGFLGDNEEWKNRSSGAYIFRPNGTKGYDIATRADVRIIRGDLVDEVHQVIDT